MNTLKYILTFTLIVLTSSSAIAQLRVEHFVRIKGQEPTVITGYGIVSGLNATGDDPRNYTPAAIAKLRQLSRSGLFGADEAGIRGGRNSALVRVTVTVPGTGGRNGDLLDAIVVSEGSATSLAGGVLTITQLSTCLQQDENALVQGMAQGRITIENAASPNVGRIVNGARLTADFAHPYIQDGLVTLVIRREHARPNMANRIADAINNNAEFQVLSIRPAQAISQNFIAVRVPTSDFADPMDFLEKILDAEVMDVPRPVPRVTINERAGIITIDADVEVRPTLVTHRNFEADIPPVIEPGEMGEFPEQFIGIDTATRLRQLEGENVNNNRLRALQASLNALQATPQDMIEIIKALHVQGAIVGEVVFID